MGERDLNKQILIPHRRNLEKIKGFHHQKGGTFVVGGGMKDRGGKEKATSRTLRLPPHREDEVKRGEGGAFFRSHACAEGRLEDIWGKKTIDRTEENPASRPGVPRD